MTDDQDLRYADTKEIHGLVQEEVSIPTKDGLEIQANLYRPDRPGRWTRRFRKS